MAVNLGGYSSNTLKILRKNDLRALNFHLKVLVFMVQPSMTTSFHPPTLNSTATYTDLELLRNEIKNITSGMNLQHLDQTLLSIEQNHLLPKSLFDWLEQNEEACMYGWMNINNIPLAFIPWKEIGTYTYPTPTSHTERLHHIIEFYDYSLTPNPPLSNPQDLYILQPPKDKREHIQTLKNNWLYSRENIKIPKWLNEKQGDPIAWLWGYINDYNKTVSSRQNPSNSQARIPLCQHLTTESEKKLGIIAALQSWTTSEDTKVLFFQRMNRAWSQRKTRQSREDMKAINTYISSDAKKKLDKLAKFNRARMNEMLELLIEEQYEKQYEELNRRYKN